MNFCSVKKISKKMGDYKERVFDQILRRKLEGMSRLNRRAEVVWKDHNGRAPGGQRAIYE